VEAIDGVEDLAEAAGERAGGGDDLEGPVAQTSACRREASLRMGYPGMMGDPPDSERRDRPGTGGVRAARGSGEQIGLVSATAADRSE
jgi:hypothetical protein